MCTEHSRVQHVEKPLTLPHRLRQPGYVLKPSNGIQSRTSQDAPGALETAAASSRLLSVAERAEAGRYHPRNTPKSLTISAEHTSGKRLWNDLMTRFGEDIHDPLPPPDRPGVRKACLEGGENEERPCPWVGCRSNNYLDVDPTNGSIKLNFPEITPWQMKPEYSCCLDVADRGGITLDEVAGALNLVRERARQIETRAILKLQNKRKRGLIDIGADDD